MGSHVGRRRIPHRARRHDRSVSPRRSGPSFSEPASSNEPPGREAERSHLRTGAGVGIGAGAASQSAGRRGRETWSIEAFGEDVCPLFQQDDAGLTSSTTSDSTCASTRTGRRYGKVIAEFAAFKNHLSYLPHSGSIFVLLRDEVASYKTSKGALRFRVSQHERHGASIGSDQRVLLSLPDLRAASFRSTAPIDEECRQQTTPLVENFSWDLPEWLRGGNDDHLSWETPFRQQAGAHCLGPTRHDHETVPVVAFGVLSRPSRFAPRVVGDIEEADDRNPRHLGARRVVAA